MFAIVETGGKQIRVEAGRKVQVEMLPGEPGSELTLDKVLLVNNGGELKVGMPYVENAKVTCEVVEHGRAKKIIVFRKWRRNDKHKKQGHRQYFTTLMIKAIEA